VLTAQVLRDPVITGAGNGLIVTLSWVAVAEHPVAVTDSVTLTVPAPAAAHKTLTELVPVPDTIVPPVTDQTYVLPGVFVTLYV
jgi:hypothetical protein